MLVTFVTITNTVAIMMATIMALNVLFMTEKSQPMSAPKMIKATTPNHFEADFLDLLLT